MNISAVNNMNNRTNFQGLFSRPVSQHKNDDNVVGHTEVKYYYRFSNETKKDAQAVVDNATKVVNFMVDSESGLRFEEGTKAVLKAQKLPFSKGEWLQYASNNPELSPNTVGFIEECLKRYGLEHYKRNITE